MNADPVAAGQAALARNDWAEARRCFEAAVADRPTPEAYEGLSWAAWLQSDSEALFAAREAAYRRYRMAGRVREAARMAMWLGTDSVDFRGESALAEGWFGRARRLLAGTPPGPELGWLWVHEAEQLLHANQAAQARDLAGKAIALGRDHGVVDLEMLGLATEGLALVAQGSVEEGMDRLGEAATAALADEFPEAWSVAWCCCYLILGCEQVRDYDRAAQWCRRVQTWAERIRFDALTLACRAYYGGVLVGRGSWTEADRELSEATARLDQLRPPTAVEAAVRLGELRRRQGRLAEAGEIFDKMPDHPLALLGRGELGLDQDDPAGARDRAEEYLRDVPPQAPTVQAAGLDLLARACAAARDLAAAQTALAELEQITATLGTDPARATVSFARGVVASAAGEPDRARPAFEDAARLFHRCGTPFEAARSQLALAQVLLELGRPAQARRTAQAAQAQLRRIGAQHEADRATPLAAAQDGTASPLTGRERQVLGLVAAGRTNREIAEALVLSEHTVNRHVTNILAKLGSASRSAAVAEALRRQLI